MTDEAIIYRGTMKPTPAQRPRCWGCGGPSPWFLDKDGCFCPDAVEWRKQRDRGNREGFPRYNPKTNCIENLSEEVIRRNEALGYKRAPLRPPIVETKMDETKMDETKSADGDMSGRGRPRKHATDAERLKAWRLAKKEDQSNG